MNMIGDALQLRGTELEQPYTLDELMELCERYHGRKGRFAYAAVRWTLGVVYEGDAIPLPLCQWALTAYGRCIGLTSGRPEALPVVTLHPTIWNGPMDESRPRPYGPRYALDVVIHELMHVNVFYRLGAWGSAGGHSSHDNPIWCSEIMRVSPRIGLKLLT